MLKKLFFLMSVLLFCSIPMFAQEAGGAAAGGHNIWIPVTAGFAMAIASGLCGLGQGKAIAGACEGIARNPGALKGINNALILGLVLIESLALYTLVIAFYILLSKEGV